MEEEYEIEVQEKEGGKIMGKFWLSYKGCRKHGEEKEDEEEEKLMGKGGRIGVWRRRMITKQKQKADKKQRQKQHRQQQR